YSDGVRSSCQLRLAAHPSTRPVSACFPLPDHPAERPPMSTFLPTVAERLPRLLFESPHPPAVADDVGRAIATAGGRWPVLQLPLKVATELVRAGGVFETPAGAAELALARLPAEWR